MTPKETWKKIWPVLYKHYKRNKTYLDYKTPWQLLVAVVLSAQCTDEAVNKITPVLFKKYPRPIDLAKAPLISIEKIIYSTGFYRAKARNIKKAGMVVSAEFKNKIPNDPLLLQKVPGVGRKSAVAIISNAFNKNIGIDTTDPVILSDWFNLEADVYIHKPVFNNNWEILQNIVLEKIKKPLI